jgi:hypothetical protein
MVPNNWKTRLGYRDQLLKFIGDDGNFCNYLVKMNGSKSLDTFGNKGNNQDAQNKTKDIKGRLKKKEEEINPNSTSDFYKQNNNLNKDTDESANVTKKQRSSYFSTGGDNGNNNFNDNNINTNYDINSTPQKNANPQNLMQINESNKQDEEEDKFYKRKGGSTFSNIFNSPKKHYSTNNITDKEKRTILEHYRNMYSFKKSSNQKISETNIKPTDKKFPFFPVISGQGGINNIRSTINLQTNNDNMNTQSNFNDRISPDAKETMSSSQKNSMFRSSIYTNLMSNKTNSNFNKTNTKIDTEMNSTFNKTSTKGKTNKLKSHTTYGPFLNINNEFDQEIEIKNPEIKRSLEDINYYGPYFSHCPACRHKNLDFYQTMEPHQCMKLLNYIKQSRSKIKVK